MEGNAELARTAFCLDSAALSRGFVPSWSDRSPPKVWPCEGGGGRFGAAAAGRTAEEVGGGEDSEPRTLPWPL
jgi:hypothetical protein